MLEASQYIQLSSDGLLLSFIFLFHTVLPETGTSQALHDGNGDDDPDDDVDLHLEVCTSRSHRLLFS